jgi:hypothetical protein
MDFDARIEELEERVAQLEGDETKPPCNHAPRASFHKGKLWCCSVCGKVGAWGVGWTWFGQLECTKCSCEVIEAVACSEECQKRRGEA